MGHVGRGLEVGGVGQKGRVWKGVKFEWTHGTSYLKALFGRISGQDEYFWE